MYQSLKNGLEISRVSIRALFRYPKLLVPLLITWLFCAFATLYLIYFFDRNEISTSMTFLLIFIVILIGTFLLSLSCSMLLELIEQQESGKKMRLMEAFLDTLGFNLLAIIPLAVIWAGVWFILLLLEILFSKNKRSREEDQELTAENAARTLAGHDNTLTLSSSFLDAMQKGFRMVVFLILPGIAWESLGFKKAFQRGRDILSIHLKEFISGFILTEAAAALIFVPAAIIFNLSGKWDVPFPDWVWYITIGYIWISWSLAIYLEQMFTAELYLWHMRWEREMWQALEEKRPIPLLKDIKLPSLLDETPDILKIQIEDIKKKAAWEEKIKSRFEG